MVPGHILTGPVAVKGAEPGDVLQIEILDVRLRQDWGYNLIRPLAGTLPDDFHETRLLNIPLDRDRMVGRLPWGLDLPLKPFFGVMGVAPPPAWGRITSLIPRAMGGNLDNRSWEPVPSCIFRCSCRARCSPAATAMACRATARSASPRLRPRCKAVSA